VPFAKRIVRIEDGSIVGEERRSEGRSTSEDRSVGEEHDMKKREQDIEEEDSIKTKRVRMQR
jgi:hypothetical protein